MKSTIRQKVLTVIALILLVVLAVYGWQRSQSIYYEDLQVFCHGSSCDYQMRLFNPGETQGVQLIWVAHKVTQDQGEIFSFIEKNTQEVAGQTEYMLAGVQRQVSGTFTRPQHTSYVVLKLRPVE